MRVLYCSGVDAYLVRADLQYLSKVIYGAYAAAHGERNEDLFRRASRYIYYGVSLLVACGYIEKGDLVRAFSIVLFGKLDRVSGISKVYEVRTFDHAPFFNIEARYNTFRKHT